MIEASTPVKKGKNRTYPLQQVASLQALAGISMLAQTISQIEGFSFINVVDIFEITFSKSGRGLSDEEFDKLFY